MPAAAIWLERVLLSISAQPGQAAPLQGVRPSQAQSWPLAWRANNLLSLAAMPVMRGSLSINVQPGQALAEHAVLPSQRQIFPST